MKYIFFSVGICFVCYFFARIFFPSKSVWRIYFLKSPILLKSQMAGPLCFINYQIKTSLLIITGSLDNPYFQFISRKEEYEVKGAVLAVETGSEIGI